MHLAAGLASYAQLHSPRLCSPLAASRFLHPLGELRAEGQTHYYCRTLLGRRRQARVPGVGLKLECTGGLNAVKMALESSLVYWFDYSLQ